MPLSQCHSLHTEDGGSKLLSYCNATWHHNSEDLDMNTKIKFVFMLQPSVICKAEYLKEIDCEWECSWSSESVVLAAMHFHVYFRQYHQTVYVSS